MGQPHTFESLKAKTVEEGDCWLWRGYSVKGLRPQVFHAGKVVGVKRLVFTLLGKPPHPGHFIWSKCGNPLCINPDHFVVRRPSEHCNAMRKEFNSSTGRSFQRQRMTLTKQAQGKLDMDKVREIRASQESISVLAEKYAVSKALISKVRRGERWRDTTNPFLSLMGGRSSFQPRQDTR